MNYEGTMFVNSDECHGYIGFVFGYQNNQRFYVAIWKHMHLNYGATPYRVGLKGLQIKVFFSYPSLL